MANFLTINNIPLSVADDSFGETVREIGATATAFSGAARRTRQAVKRDCQFETPLMITSDAFAWDGLIRGLGEHWTFDTSLYGSKGLGPNAGFVATQSTTGGKFGGHLSVSATTGTITYAAQLGANWTAAFYRFESSVWNHYVILSTGTKYLNGVSSGVATTWFSVTSGSATITNATAAAVLYDGLVLLPFVIPAAWPASLSAATSAFSALPRLTIAGDAVPEGSRTVQGDASASLQQGAIGGAWSQNLRTLSVTLSEA